MKALLAGWVACLPVALLFVVGRGSSIRGAVVPAVVVATIFTPLIVVPLVSRFGPAQGTASVRPTASVSVAGAYDDVFARCVEAVGSVPGARIVRATASTGDIRARVALTSESWGERVRVNVHPVPGGAEVTVSSRPVHPGTVIDQARTSGTSRRCSRASATGLSAAGLS